MPVSVGMRIDGYRSGPQPDKHTAAILRRVARGYILVTRAASDDGKSQEHYSYEDGTPVNGVRGDALSTMAFRRMVKEEWLIPISGESLFGDPVDAQRYRARQPSDGALPDIRNKKTGERPMLPFKREVAR